METIDRLQLLALEKKFDPWIAQRIKLINGETTFVGKWQRLSDWVSGEKVPNSNGELIYLKPNQRQVFPDEIVVESDFENPERNKHLANRVMKKLKDNKINYETWFTGSKSFHVHFWIRELLEWNDISRPLIKNALVEYLFSNKISKYIDSSNHWNKTLIQIEGTRNIKTGKPSEFVASYEKGKEFKIPDKVIEIARKRANTKKQLSDSKTELKVPCPLVSYALNHKLPSGNRNNILCKNASAILTEEQMIQLANVQDMPEKQVLGWKKRKWEYNVFEMIDYSEKIGLFYLFEDLVIENG